MYILIVSRGYPSDEYKMNGLFEFDQAKALIRSGFKVVYAVVDVRSIRRKRKWGFESFIKDGVQVEAINVPCGKLPNTTLDAMRTLALKKLYKKIEGQYGKPFIIHAHFLNYGYITARIFEKKGIPLVLTEHLSAMSKDYLDPYLIKLGLFTYPKMDKVISVSTALSDNILEKFGIENIVIPNIVEVESFDYKINTKRKRDFNFVSTGGLIARKGMDQLVEAFYKTFKNNNNVYLYIYGEGPERNKLEKMIRQYNLSKNVFLMGLVNRKEIADRMAESDCFVLASKLETFGVAYIEAMSAGLPVIATICGGPESFVTKSNGILIPKDSVNSIAKAMSDIYENIDKYDKKFISDSTKELYSPQTISKKLSSVYKNLLNKSE